MTALSVTANRQAAVLVLGRLFLVLLFLITGTEEAIQLPGVIEYARQYNLPFPNLLVPSAVALHIIGGIAILLGWQTRRVSYLFILFVAIAGPWFHRFWDIDRLTAPRAWQQMSDDFFQHIAIIGGFVVLAVWGPGKYSLDDYFSREKRKHS